MIRDIRLTELDDESFQATAKLYGGLSSRWVRAFTVGHDIFLNKDAFFLLGNFSRLQLIAHEIGHVMGLGHSWMNPVMWRIGILRP